MSLKNLIAFILAVMIGSQSVFAIGAFTTTTTDNYHSVSGYESEAAALNALMISFTANGLTPRGGFNSVVYVPNGMYLEYGYCSWENVPNYRIGPILSSVTAHLSAHCRNFYTPNRPSAWVREHFFLEPCARGRERKDNVCQATISSCNGINQILNNNACQSCPNGQERNGNICQIVQTTCNANNQILVNGACRSCSGNTPIRNGNLCQASSAGGGSSSGGSGGGGSGSTFLYIGAGAAVVGALYFFTSPDSIGRFSPDYNYSLTENGYTYNIGGRWNYQRDNWRLHWTARQDNSKGEFGDFRYSSGAEYDGGFWAAEFSESVSGKVADYDFSLSAEMSGSNWKISPIYRLQSHYENLLTGWESDTDNSLNLESIWHYNRWTVKPSAGFQWQNGDEFGDNAQFNLSAVWQF